MVFNTLRFIYAHPFNSQNKFRGVLRYINWKINCLINPYPIIYPYTENSKLIIQKTMPGATGNIYCGLIEFDDMGFLLHFLRKSDVFIDVGANVGAYTILASSEIGAKTIAIEPIPSTFKKLIQNININQIDDKVKPLNIGLAAKKDTIQFTKSMDTGNHVAMKDEMDTIEIEVDTLDAITVENKPSLLKIDVEGFETEILNGASEVLKSDTLKAIIIELNGLGEKYYGYDEQLIHLKLINHGFQPCKYNPKIKGLMEKEKGDFRNTLYVRDLEFVKNRVKTAREIKVGSNLQSL